MPEHVVQALLASRFRDDVQEWCAAFSTFFTAIAPNVDFPLSGLMGTCVLFVFVQLVFGFAVPMVLVYLLDQAMLNSQTSSQQDSESVQVSMVSGFFVVFSIVMISFMASVAYVKSTQMCIP